VSFARVTVIPMPYKEKDNHGLRPRIEASAPDTGRVLHKPTPRDLSPLGWLQLGKASRMHEKRGWLRKLLIHEGLLVPEDGPLWTRILSDYKFVLGTIEGMKIALGSKFVDPRDHKGIQGPHDHKFISQKTNAQKDVPKNEFTQPYLFYAYDVSRTTFQNRVKNEKLGKCSSSEARPSVYKGATAIDNRALAKMKFTPRFFSHECMLWRLIRLHPYLNCGKNTRFGMSTTAPSTTTKPKKVTTYPVGTAWHGNTMRANHLYSKN
jgi:hypothetical protein